MQRPFRDRTQAGQLLAGKLKAFHFSPRETIVLALPRGGVVLAFEVAQALALPLDVCVVRKLGVPWQPELAMGAIATGGVVVLHDDLIAELGIPPAEVERELADERQERKRRERAYRGNQPLPDLTAKTVIVVDDGIATGATVEAAVQALRLRHAAQVVVAVGVAPSSTLRRLARVADHAVAVIEAEDLGSIGEWFADFNQVEDNQVRTLLERARQRDAMEAVTIGSHHLAGDLIVPDGAKGLVVFAHGSGSSRHSPRNRYVAAYLNSAGFATLLMDLLTEDEDRNAETRFDIQLLGNRLGETLAWVGSDPRLGGLPVALFGASTGAAAVLDAAAHNPGACFAVVSRGGRPDLATSPLGNVRAPVLLIVGGDDGPVVRLNESVLPSLPPSARLKIVPGATHLFEEPGTLEAVARLACEWFLRHLPRSAGGGASQGSEDSAACH